MKMKDVIRRLACFALAAVLGTACDFETYQGRELSSSITVTPQEISFEGSILGQADVEIRCMGDWIIIAPEALRVLPLYGTGDGKVSVSRPAAADRDYTFYVCGTDVTVPVVVRMEADDGNGNTEINHNNQ